MIQSPPGSTAQFCHHHIAVTQHVDIKVDVRDRLRRVSIGMRGKEWHGRASNTDRAGDVDLRYLGGEEANHLRYGRNLERRPNDNDQVDQITVMLGETVVESSW